MKLCEKWELPYHSRLTERAYLVARLMLEVSHKDAAGRECYYIAPAHHANKGISWKRALALGSNNECLVHAYLLVSE